MRILSCGVLWITVACGGAASTTLVDGGTMTNDAGPGGNLQTVTCGTSACNIPSQSCCVYETQPAWTYACVDGTTCPTLGGGPANGGTQGSALACSGAANCGNGTVCCVYEAPNVSACMPSCPSGGAQLCDPTAATSGCTGAAGCSSANIGDWGLPKGYATCGGVGN